MTKWCAERRCGEYAEWCVEYALCDWTASPPERVGRCRVRGGVRGATSETCDHFRERKEEG